LPNTIVNDLQSVPNTVDFQSIAGVGTILVAATYGRGAWAILINPSTINGQVFFDHNGNGIKDANDQGLNVPRVFLDANGNGSFDTLEPSTTTDAGGHYEFDAVAPGTYTIRVVAPSNYVPTTPTSSFTVSGSNLTQKDFGLTTFSGLINPGVIWDLFKQSNAEFEAKMKSLLERRKDDFAAMKPKDILAPSYLSVADLNALPGRKPGQPVGAENEFEALSPEKPR